MERAFHDGLKPFRSTLTWKLDTGYHSLNIGYHTSCFPRTCPLFGPKKMRPAGISKSPKMSGIQLLLAAVAIHCVRFCIKAQRGTVFLKGSYDAISSVSFSLECYKLIVHR